jgi:hypothetical protein
MILVRFVYENYLYGEWTEADPNGPMLVPNPGYKDRLIGVQAKETDNEARAARPKHAHAPKFGTVPNGHTET